ncbi:type II toxin-antitoxin system VapC family toxin [Candidatus Gottesmanbacteria bacterium]|nr:type II toxin-antitoxin system VapC family toxin [Candidatus Gottesmanbacteria bacterium]
MYLLDTNILIWILRGDEGCRRLLQKLKTKGSIGISTISIAEVYKNIFPSELVNTEELFRDFVVYDVSVVIAKQSGYYWQEFYRKTKNIHMMDCIIAATARNLDLTLVTLNKKDFPMKDIEFYSLPQSG